MDQRPAAAVGFGTKSARDRFGDQSGRFAANTSQPLAASQLRSRCELAQMRPRPGGADLDGVQRIVLGEDGVAVVAVVGNGGQNVARYCEAASRT